MSETQETPVLSPALYLQREGVRQYSATNPRGAQVLVGEGPGRFSPGELLKIAVAGCNAMSSDKRLTDRLGGRGCLRAVPRKRRSLHPL